MSVVSEIIEASAKALWDQRLALAIAFVAAPLLALADRKLLGRRWPWLVLLAAALGLGFYRAWQVLWLCDDAFISFRYSQNLAQGHGLVFNVGEWVEGYTNFLWTVGLAAAAKLGADIPQAGLWGNLACFGLAILATAWTVRRAAPGAAVPFAALLLGGSAAFTTFASSGLETMPATFCVVLGVLLSTTRARAWVVGLAFTAAALTRPDHVLYGAAMGAGLVAEDLFHRRDWNWRRWLSFAAPFLVVFLPYWLWRWSAYGDFWPNTFYAKSGDRAYWSQGGVYLAHFLATTGMWLGFPALLLAAFGGARDPNDSRLRAFALLSALGMGGYVAKVGGDFMEHRFLLTLLPVIAISLEVALRTRLNPRNHPVAAAGPARLGTAALGLLALLALVLGVTPTRPIGKFEKKWNLAAEESFYRVVARSPLAIDSIYFGHGRALLAAFPASGFQPRYAVGCVGMIGYLSGLPLVDVYGLVNRRIAHLPIEARGRPGHEKRGSFEDLWAEGADLGESPGWPEFATQTTATIPGLQFHVYRWTPPLAEAIARAGGSLPSIDGEIARLAASDDPELQLRGLTFLRRYLEKDPQRERRLLPLESLSDQHLDRLASLPSIQMLELLRLLEEQFPEDPRVIAARARLAARWDFEDGAWPKGYQVSGSGWGAPARGTLPGQQPVTGVHGAHYLSSFHGADEGLGRVEVALPAASRLYVSALVGGGLNCDGVWIGLEVDGVMVSKACGVGTEVLRAVALEATLKPGQQAKLVMVDDLTGGWGHLMVDDVMVIADPGTTD